MEKIIELINKGALVVKGEGSEAFLQGLLTNDIRQLTENSDKFIAQRSALLTPQGRVITDLIIIFQKGYFYLITDQDFLPELAAKLERYKLMRTQVSFSVTDKAIYQAWYEPDSEVIFQAETKAKKKDTQKYFPSDSEITFYQDGGDREIGFWGLGRTGLLMNSTKEDWHQHRIKRGLIERSADLLFDERGFLLSEINFDWLNGVSFTKGCYLGQEITSRIHYRGLTKKRVIPVIFTEEKKPVTGEKLYIDGQEIGVVLSAYQTRQEAGALCCLKTDFISTQLNKAERSCPIVQIDRFFLQLCPSSTLRNFFLAQAKQVDK